MCVVPRPHPALLKDKMTAVMAAKDGCTYKEDAPPRPVGSVKVQVYDSRWASGLPLQGHCGPV